MGTLIRGDRRDKDAREADEAAAQGQQYLIFRAGGEQFAVGISSIREIIEYREVTAVPMMPDYLRGIINLRGRVVPVIDLLARFGRDSTEVSQRTCIVIMEVESNDERQYIGIVVDAVNAVLEIADADIEPPPSFGAKLRKDFISGMGKIGEKFVILLDIAHVLSVEELAILADVSEEDAAT